MPTLNSKQRVFVEHYLTCWNAAEAARQAGYSEKSAREQASRLLTNVNIRTAIQARLAELTMSADEILVRLAAQARGSMADFLDVSESGWTLNLTKAAEQGKLGLIKKIKATQAGTEIELYDAQAALALLGRHHKLFVDRAELTGKDGEPIQIENARAQLAERLTRRLATGDPSAGTGGDSGA